MIPIGPRPHLYPTTDRWGAYDGGVEVMGYGWATEGQYRQILCFQDPLPSFPKGTTIEEATASEAGQDLKAKIAMAGGSTLWQLEILTPDRKDRMRTLAVLGSDHLVAWSWFDRHVMLPILQIRARLHNHLYRKHPC